jgi:hypothetical protein
LDLPYLKGALTKDDLRRKNKFDYLPWAKCLQVINENAPGWMPERGEICHAADSSVWIQVRWVHISGEAKTPWFDYALRDFSNKAVTAEKATAKAICDACRRAYCASAAAFFSLNYETYVDEEFEPQEDASAPRASATAESADVEPPIEEVQGVLIDLLAKADAGKVSTYLDMRAKKFGLTQQVRGSWIAAMSIDQLQICIDELNAAK